MKYRKKPVVIEALQLIQENEEKIREWLGGKLYVSPMGEVFISTLKGYRKVNINDYIIQGVKGEFYSCKPDIFELTYEKV